MEKFRGVDYYGIDELLTEEQRMMRDAVRDWVEAKFLPIVSQHHRDGTFPTVVKATASPGLFSVAADDFTGDGKPDLVVANRSSGRVYVLSNIAQ